MFEPFITDPSDAPPLIVQPRPAHEAVIERLYEQAMREIRQMADAARIAIGYRISFANRSRGQKRRFALARRTHQGASK